MSDVLLPPTLVGLQAALAAGELSAAEALQHQVRNIARNAPAWRCVVHLHDVAGDPLRSAGRLAGIGLAHKDIFALHHRHPGCGLSSSPRTRSWPKQLPREARVLQQLASAGACNLAALSMTPFACGATGESLEAPEPVNPLGPDVAVGGSSSGSAVAVAAGLCYASLGTDSGGSVRIPAATCGVVGLKPTQAAISCDGVFPLAPSLDCPGIIARSALDVAQVLAAIQDGPAARPVERLAPTALLSPRTWRLRWAVPGAEMPGDVADALVSFVDALGRTAKVKDIVPERWRLLGQLADIVLHAEAAQQHGWRFMGRAHATSQSAVVASANLRAVVLAGLAVPAAWYERAIAGRADEVRHFCNLVFADADLLLLPALGGRVPDWASVRRQSPDFDTRALLALYRYMAFVNYLGLPAIVFPVGRDARGLPVCVQVLARPHGERELLQFAAQWEQASSGTSAFPSRFAADH